MKQVILAIALATCVVLVRAQAPRPLGPAGRASANVSLASSGRFVAAVWSVSAETGDQDIQAAVSHDAGATFLPPVRVNRTPGSARVGGEQPPRVVLVVHAAGDPDVVVAWTGTGAAGTRLVNARSTDGGRTFSAEAIVPGSDAPGNRGWESLAVGPDGRVVVAWLDHRDTMSASDMSHHMDHTSSPSTQADSVARAQLSKLYFTAIEAGASGRPIAAGVCYCCKTALAAGTDGSIYAAWRHVYAGNVRDIAFAASKDRGRTFSQPVRVSEDKWAIDGCPENGPAIALDRDSTVHLAWPTFVPGPGAGGGTLALFYARSRDGRQFTPRQQIPTTGTPRHVQIAAVGGGGLALAWDESDARGRHVVFARGTIRGDRADFKVTTLAMLGDAQYPALAVTPGGILVAATSGRDRDSTIRIVSVGGQK